MEDGQKFCGLLRISELEYISKKLDNINLVGILRSPLLEKRMPTYPRQKTRGKSKIQKKIVSPKPILTPQLQRLSVHITTGL